MDAAIYFTALAKLCILYVVFRSQFAGSDVILCCFGRSVNKVKGSNKIRDVNVNNDIIGLQGNFAQIFMIPRRRSLLTLVIPRLFL